MWSVIGCSGLMYNGNQRVIHQPSWYIAYSFLYLSPTSSHHQGGGPRLVVSTAAFHARVRGSVPGLGGLKETKMFQRVIHQPGWYIAYSFLYLSPTSSHLQGGSPGVVVSTAAFHASFQVRFPVSAVWKKQKCFFPIHV